MFINNFDPVAFQVFSLEIRWYSLSYIIGLILGWIYCKKKLINDEKTKKIFDDYIAYLVLGIIIGGRLHLKKAKEVICMLQMEKNI